MTVVNERLERNEVMLMTKFGKFKKIGLSSFLF
jgi:hypothetical protein